MPSDRPTAAALPLALVVCVLVVAGLPATPSVAVGDPLTVTTPQDPAADEAPLALDRPTRRLIQQGLRNEGFDPGTPDGLFGPRSRAAIRDWQQSHGASPTGYLSGAEAELLRTAAMPPPAVSESAPPPQAAVPALQPDASSAAAPPASTPAAANSNPAPLPVPTEAAPQNAPGSAARNAQLLPEILVDRHLVRLDRLLADDDYGTALPVMDELVALQREHNLPLAEDFHFKYAEVAFAAGLAEPAINLPERVPPRRGETRRLLSPSPGAAGYRRRGSPPPGRGTWPSRGETPPRRRTATGA